MDKNHSSSMHEEASLSEESDGSSGGAFNANDAMLVALQSLNKNMTEMGISLRSLKEKGETQTPTMAVPTTKQYLTQNGNPCQQGITLTQRNQMQTHFWLQTGFFEA